MEFKAEQIAGLINGKILGNPNEEIRGFSPIEKGQEGHLSFIANEKFAHYLEDSPCSVLIVSEKLLTKSSYSPTVISVEDAYLSFQVLMNLYDKMRVVDSGIEDTAKIHQSAKIGSDVYIGDFVYIASNAEIGEGTQIHPHAYIGKNVKIGNHCKIESGVKIHDHCIVGNNCNIHSNTVIGSDGFGFQPSENGYSKIPQLGNVLIHDNVEIGSNCSIDRGTLGSTIIGKGTKIDNLIQIAHNVQIGENNVIAAQAGIAGSTTIGNWNQIGGQVGIVGHITIGNKVKIQAQSGVNSSTKDGEVLYGSPAINAGNYRRNYVHFKNFSDIVNKINNLENNSKDKSNE